MLTKNALHSPGISLTGDKLSDDAEDLLNLINGSLGAAGWLIVMTVGIVIAEIVFIVLSLVLVNIQPTVKLIFGIIVSFADGSCYYTNVCMAYNLYLKMTLCFTGRRYCSVVL